MKWILLLLLLVCWLLALKVSGRIIILKASKAYRNIENEYYNGNTGWDKDEFARKLLKVEKRAEKHNRTSRITITWTAFILWLIMVVVPCFYSFVNGIGKYRMEHELAGTLIFTTPWVFGFFILAVLIGMKRELISTCNFAGFFSPFSELFTTLRDVYEQDIKYGYKEPSSNIAYNDEKYRKLDNLAHICDLLSL